METTLAILMILGVFVGIPAVVGFAIAGVYITSGRRALRAARARALGEVAEALPMEPARAPIGNRALQWTILVFLCVYYPILYYFGELVDHFGWGALRWEFWYTVHDVHRVFFLIPILYASYYFGIKGGVITTILAFAVFLPRGLWLSPFPDPTSRMVVFIIFALCLGVFVGTLRNRLEQLQRSVDASRA